MDKHDEEYVLYGLHKDIEVAFEDDDHHSDEHYDGQVLQRLLQELCHFWKVLAAQDSQYKRDSHYDEDALEDVPERNFKFRKCTEVTVAGKVQIHLSPECEVERSGEYAGSSIECCERYRKL